MEIESWLHRKRAVAPARLSLHVLWALGPREGLLRVIENLRLGHQHGIDNVDSRPFDWLRPRL